MAVHSYETTPGLHQELPAEWPHSSTIERSGGQPTLVVFVHPRCPCTRATISELSRLVTENPQKMRVNVLYYKPAGADSEWDDTDICMSAKQIPEAIVRADLDGVEARRFSAATSGQALLYDTHGKLLFAGGLTAARGQLGDSAGTRAIAARLSEGTCGSSDAAVYGCSIIKEKS